MNNAVVAQEGEPRELYEAPVSRFVADFIGDANIVEAEILAADGAAAEVRLGPTVQRLPRRGLPCGPALLAIRPEAIQLSDAPASDGLAGEILKASYLGSHIEYRVRSPIGDLFVIDRRVDRSLPPETRVGISLAGHGVTLVASD
jgi:iron(III) transport system ATP-binding protein